MPSPARGRAHDHDEWVPGEREVGSPTEVTLLFQARARALLRPQGRGSGAGACASTRVSKRCWCVSPGATGTATSRSRAVQRGVAVPGRRRKRPGPNKCVDRKTSLSRVRRPYRRMAFHPVGPRRTRKPQELRALPWVQAGEKRDLSWQAVPGPQGSLFFSALEPSPLARALLQGEGLSLVKVPKSPRKSGLEA